MTTGSGNGWPDVIKVPPQAPEHEHDEFCQRDEPDHWCECALIRRVRANEQERHGNNCGGMWDEWTHDLREQVAALWLTSDTDHDYNDGYEAAKRDVLDLIDGGSDG